MGKGKRSQSINSLSFPRSMLENGGLLTPQKLEPLPAVLSTTVTARTTTAGTVRYFATKDTKKKISCRWNTSRAKSYEDYRQELKTAPLHILVVTYLNIFTLILLGHLRDIVGKFCKPKEYAHLKMNQGYAPLVSDFDSFYTRRLYMRIRDCWNRSITGVPGRQLNVLERYSPDYNKTFKLTGKVTENLNFSSYNYLGFAQNYGPCADNVEASVRELGISSCGVRAESGTTDLHRELEQVVAKFVGKEDAMVISMGFATNSTTIPALAGKGCLIISDELNHSSIIFGVRLSGASVRTFKHNDMNDLRELLREVISQGQPRTHRLWKKILVVVEGLYSMEGTIVNLPALIELKKEFKFYLYVDEAHSVGALGNVGGGVCNFYGIDPSHVDILMGTFTKSFGSAGGYIAGDKAIIDHLRIHNHAYNYAESMSVPVAQQVLTSMKIIAGDDGTGEGQRRIDQLAKNSLYFSTRLRQLGFIVYGDVGSPVIPLLLFQPAKIPCFSRELLKRGIAVVVVGYPATTIISSRARFCISASHTKRDLDLALEAISEIGDKLSLKMNKEDITSKLLNY
ncbi:MAG: pyridoxal phosphate-dependent transferase [Benjaminiella poitrasii]|nr:MAG: pyridoxal phosphate-dependent transferase [Benjaminiella poitrasii]